MAAVRTNLQRKTFSRNAKKLNEAKREKRLADEQEYLLFPISCKRVGCESIIPFDRRCNQFCSKSCSAKVANANRSQESRKKQRQTIKARYAEQQTTFDDKDLRSYRRRCRFQDIDLRRIAGHHLVRQHGWYDPYSNLNGCVMDHRYSVSQGFKNGIDPQVLSHPANCEILLQRENCSKNSKCSISLDDLQNAIRYWNK